MTVSEVLKLPLHLLREITTELWGTHSQASCMRLGAALWRIREEKIFKAWSHDSFYLYCRNELQLKPTNSENWRIAVFTRFRAIGLTDEDMDRVESLKPRSEFLTRLRKICQNREQVLDYLLHPDKERDLAAQIKEMRRNAKFSAKSSLKTFNYGRSRAEIGPFYYHFNEFDVIRGTFEQMLRNFSLSQDRCLLAISLVFKILRETTPENRYAELKRQCLFFSIPQEFVDFVFGEEAWRRVK